MDQEKTIKSQLKLKLIDILTYKEAVASVALDNDPDMETICGGLINNPKLFKISVKIVCSHTNKVVWKGSMAHAFRAFRRLVETRND